MDLETIKKDRHATFDPERVYVAATKAYSEFLEKLSKISNGLFSISNLEETWKEENSTTFSSNNKTFFEKEKKQIIVECSFVFEKKKETFWVGVKGDFMDLSMIYIPNKLIEQSGYRFEMLDSQEEVMFVNQEEKNELMKKHHFRFYNPLHSIHSNFLLLNGRKNIEHKNYELAEELLNYFLKNLSVLEKTFQDSNEEIPEFFAENFVQTLYYLGIAEYKNKNENDAYLHWNEAASRGFSDIYQKLSAEYKI